MAYAIKISPNYCTGTITTETSRFLSAVDLDETGRETDAAPIEWDTEAEAQEVADNYEKNIRHDGTYYLSNGEYASPDIDVIDLDNINDSDCIEGSYDGTVSRSEIPADTLKKLESANVEYQGDYDESHEIYSWEEASSESDEAGDSPVYKILYTVSKCMLQLKGLDGIDWDNAVYTLSSWE